MGQRRKNRRKQQTSSRRWWTPLDEGLRRRLRGGLKVLFVAGVVIAGAVGVARLEAHVDRQINERCGRPVLTFLDVPDQLEESALDSLRESVADLSARDWTDAALCRDMTARLESVGWVARVHFVRRTGNGRIEVSGAYRLPVALVRQGSTFLLVDGEGVRLPGTYLYTPSWKLVEGVAAPAPPPGEPWEGEDLSAGLAVLAAVEGERFGRQITAVLVDNVGGRRDSRRGHVELATDRAGGRIRWGSAPGMELEENTVEQKLAILRENYRQTGRIDAAHPVIDISTFPDRFTIPG